MKLGLDISSSVIGMCIIDDKNLIFYEHLDIKKIKSTRSYFKTLEYVENYFLKLFDSYNITEILIEEPIKRLSNGKSSISTILTLYSYNLPITWILYKISNIEPKHIKASSARKDLQIKKSNIINNNIKYHKSTKEIKVAALDRVLELYPKLKSKFTYTKTGLLHPYWFDIADAIVIASN